MSHYAEINSIGTVLRVIVAEEEFIKSGAVGNPENWVKTSFNTYGGQHKLGGKQLRKNFAGIGMKYDKELDAFIGKKPFSSWLLNPETCLFEAPIKKPQDGKNYFWNEELKIWSEIKL